MPRKHPEEFRRRAVELASQRDEHGKRVISIAQLARDLGMSESGLRRWVDQDAIDSGQKAGLSTAERKEIAEMRRRVRVLEMENEILKLRPRILRRRTFSQNDIHLHRPAMRRSAGQCVLPGVGGVNIGVLSTKGPPVH